MAMLNWELVWEWIFQLALILMALVASGPIVYNWVDGITERFGWSDWRARATAGAVAFLLGAAGVIAQGILTPDMLQPENAAVLFIAVWGASQAHYSKMKREQARLDAAYTAWMGASEAEYEIED
jgi:hypothetical protein